MSRSSRMNGRAMLAMVASSTTISWATEIRTSAQPRWLWPCPAVDGCAVVTDPGVVSASLMGFLALSYRVWVVRGRVRVEHGGEDDVVDDALDDRVVGGEAHHEGAVQQDPGQRRADHLEVDVVPDLAAGLGPLVDLGRDGELRRDEALAELRGELGVAGERGDDGTEGTGARVAGRPLGSAEGGEQVAAQGAGVGQLDVRGTLGAQQCVDRRGSPWSPSGGRAWPCWRATASRRRPS